MFLFFFSHNKLLTDNMDSVLGELITACRAADTEKVTERKKQVAKIKSMLNKGPVTKLLDTNSDQLSVDQNKNMRNFNWDNMIKATKNIVLQEAACLKKSKAKSAASAAKATQNHEAVSLLKMVVKLANKGKPKLHVNHLVKHIIEVLSDDYMCSIYCTEYTSLLLKDVLQTRKCRMDIHHETVIHLTDLVCKLLVDAPKQCDRGQLARILHSLVFCSIQTQNLKTKKLVSFFQQFYENIKNERTVHVVEYVTAAMQLLCESQAPNYRLLICHLGEKICSNLLFVWKQHKSVVIKKEIIHFLLLQMQLHHPNGQHYLENVCFNYNCVKWKECVHQIFEVIMNDVSQLTNRSRITAEKSAELGGNLVKLASRVFIEMLHGDPVIKEMDRQDSEPAAKKRKKTEQISWNLILEPLGKPTMSTIPWLQILTELFKHSKTSNLLGNQYKYALTLLLQIQKESHESAVLEHCLYCLMSLAELHDAIPVTATEEKECLLTWNKVWQATLRQVSLHHLEEESYKMMEKLIHFRLVSVGTEIAFLFKTYVNKCTQGAAEFLCELLCQIDVEDVLSGCKMEAHMDIEGVPQCPVSSKILEWMFPVQQRFSDKQICLASETVEANILAKLVSLITSFDDFNSSNHLLHSESEKIQHIEQLCLRIQFEENIKRSKKEAETGIKLKEFPRKNITSLIQFVDKLIIRDTKYLLGLLDNNVNIVMKLLKQCHLMISIIARRFEDQFYTVEEIIQSPLTQQLKLALNQITLTLCGLMNKDPTALTTVAPVISQMFSFRKHSVDTLVKITHMCQMVIPPGFVQLLLEGIEKVFQSGQNNNIRTQTTQLSRRNSSFSERRSRGRSTDFELDDEFDFLGDADSDMDMEDEEEQDEFSVQESQEVKRVSHSDNFDTGNLLLFNSLPELEKTGIFCADTLCSVFQCSKEDSSVSDIPKGEVFAEDVCTNLVQLLSEDKIGWDCTKSFCLQLLQHIVNGLSGVNMIIEAKNVDVILQSLRKTSKQHRKDPEICCMVLSLLRQLVPLVCSGYNTSKSEIETTNMKILLHLFEVFQELSMHASVGARLAVLQCLRQILEIGYDEEELPDSENTMETNSHNCVGIFSQNLVECLKDKHTEVRLAACDCLPVLFSNVANLSTTEMMNRHDNIFSVIYETLQDIVVAKDKQKKGMEDQIMTRTSTVLEVLYCIGYNSRVCEKKTVLAFMQMLVEHNLDLSLTTKVLKSLSCDLGYESYEKFITYHIPFVLHQWFLLDYALADFPIELCCVDNIEEFYKSFHNLLVPCLLVSKQLDTIEDIAVALNQNRTDLLEQCLPGIIVHMLPYFACCKHGLIENKENEKNALESYGMLKLELSEPVINQLIATHLDEVIMNILRLLFEPVSNLIEPEPNPPYFQTEVVKKTLIYLAELANASSMIALLIKSQDGIQQVLLKLSENLNCWHWLYERKRGLQMFSLFVNLVLQEFQTGLGGAWAYVLRTVIYTLIHQVTQQRDDVHSELGQYIIIVCLELLKQTCEKGLEICPEEMSRFVGQILSCVVSMNCQIDRINQKKQELLEMLLGNTSDSVIEAVTSLPSLPDMLDSDTADLSSPKENISVLKQLNGFLHSTGNMDTVSAPLLQALGNTIHEEKSFLIELAEDEINHQLFTELIHRLGCLCSYPDKNVCLAAAKCLGEISDIACVFVPGASVSRTTAPQIPDTYKDNAVYQQFHHIFHYLDQCLLDSDISVLKTASKLIKQLLNTECGQKFAADYKNKKVGSLFQYLFPFKSVKKQQSKMKLPESSFTTFKDKVANDELWCPATVDSYDVWIKNLCGALIDSSAVSSEVLVMIKPMCLLQAKFSVQVLPYLIHNILHNGTDQHRGIISQYVGSFFNEHCKEHKANNVSQLENNKKIVEDRESVKALLNVVQYLREQDKPAQGRKAIFTPWNNNFWLDVDYLHLAQAAFNCGSFFTTVLFVEIWCTQQGFDFKKITTEDGVSNYEATTGLFNPQYLMLQAFCNIGEPDAMYGCGAGRLPNRQTRIQTYEHENEWSHALLAHDMEMSISPVSPDSLLKALHTFGSSHLLDRYLQSLDEKDEKVKEFQYCMAWRNCDWKSHVSYRKGSMSYNECVYGSLQSLQQNEKSMVHYLTNKARGCLMEEIKEKSHENLISVLPALVKLSSLNLIDQAILSNHIQTKAQHTAMSKVSFDLLEPIWTLQCVLSEIDTNSANDSSSLIQTFNHWHKLVHHARLAGRFQKAERGLEEMKTICSQIGDEKLQSRWQLEEALLYWSREETNIAKYLMQKLLQKFDHHKHSSTSSLHSKCLVTYGQWLCDTKSEHPSVINQQYLTKAVEMYDDQKDTSIEAVGAFVTLAKFADGQYQHIVNYMQSSTFEAKQALIKEAKQEAEKIKELGHQQTQSRYYRTLDKQRAIDEKELKAMVEDKYSFLEQAVENYVKCLQYGNEYNLRVFRLVSLWFDNASHLTINQSMQEAIQKIQSYKFLPLMYQLAARMSIKKHHCEIFQSTLDELIEKAAREHPYHTLFIIMALAHANKDEELISSERSKSKRTKQSTTEVDDEERVVAAKQMIVRLKSSNIADIITRTEKLAVAYIQLANFNVDKYKNTKGPVELPSGTWLKQISNLTNVAVPTLNMKVDPNCQYSDIVHVIKFKPTFSLAGGINLPKIISCIGSDGVSRRQLVKGKDDLRQDAVMQQVFHLVNKLLCKNQETKERKLNIRTYNVIPMSQRSGILEWCEGTQPFGEYLISQNGAHSRYRPQDYAALKCRRMMTAAHQAENATAELKLAEYIKACEGFQPVFRHFFMENFPNPVDWFHRRTAYTHSVATNSIVGYIVGLGDRHVQNILIDNTSGEMVHIDLGVAFEQGKILPTPETVPFRLTRDVVDGMGITGVEGVFSRCCEKTLTVMRQSQDELLTILQVLLYDPLYTWSLSPLKAYKLQHRREKSFTEASDPANTTMDLTNMLDDLEPTKSARMSQDINKMAERVLMRVKNKLQGIEEGMQLSVAGQVSLLIQEAIDPKNLSRLFPGWQPYV